MLFRVGVSADRTTGSNGLLQILSHLGFSITPDEVNRYKQTVMLSDEGNLPPSRPDSFTQWPADSVDHNTATLDGLGTFHGMGIISMSVPNGPLNTLAAGCFGEVPIQRQQCVKITDIVWGRHFVLPNVPALSTVILKPLLELQVHYNVPSAASADLLWRVGWFLEEKRCQDVIGMVLCRESV